MRINNFVSMILDGTGTPFQRRPIDGLPPYELNVAKAKATEVVTTLLNEISFQISDVVESISDFRDFVRPHAHPHTGRVFFSGTSR